MQFINEEIVPLNCTVLNKKISPDKKEILITIIGENISDSLTNQISLRKEKYGLKGAKIILKNGLSKDNSGPNINQLKTGIIEDMFLRQEEILRLKNEEIAVLKNRLDDQKEFNELKETAIQEFYALYGHTEEIIIEKSFNHTINDSTTLIDPTLIVYVKNIKSNLNKNDLEKLENWLTIKFNIEKVKVVIDK
jgi:hypothetical protein